jgi:hypothetical protein
MKLDASKFKKISADENETVMEDMESGHSIKIAHKALSPKMRKQLNQLPIHMKDGGEVPSPVEAEKDEKKKNSLLQGGYFNPNNPDAEEGKSSFLDLLKYGAFGKDVATPPPAMSPTPTPQNPPMPASVAPPQEAAPMAPQPTLAPQPQAAQPAAMNPAQMASAQGSGLMAGLGQIKSGLNMEAKALDQQGQRDAELADQEAMSLQEIQKNFEMKSQELNSEYKALTEDIEKSRIDPSRFTSSMSSGQKTRTVIGLLLSGLGGNDTSWFDKQIEQDIQAQEKEMDKKQNLLKFNMQQLGNLTDAKNATIAMMKGINAAQIRKSAALAQSPIAKARALQAAGKLDMEAAPLLQQVAQKQAVLGTLKSGKASPIMAINAIVPKDQQSAALKELGEFNGIQSALAQVDSALDSAFKSTTLSENITSPIQSSKKRDMAVGELFPIVKAIVGEKMTDADVQNMVKPFLPGMTTNKETADQAKVKLKQKLLGMVKGRTPILTGYGIIPDPGQVNFTPLRK